MTDPAKGNTPDDPASAGDNPGSPTPLSGEGVPEKPPGAPKGPGDTAVLKPGEITDDLDEPTPAPAATTKVTEEQLAEVTGAEGGASEMKPEDEEQAATDRFLDDLIRNILENTTDRKEAGNEEKAKALANIELVKKLLAKCRNKNQRIKLLEAALKTGGQISLGKLSGALVALFGLLETQSSEMAKLNDDPIYDEAETFLTNDVDEL
jgi:hypothetical protein